jgi:hypothetical protein
MTPLVPSLGEGPSLEEGLTSEKERLRSNRVYVNLVEPGWLEVQRYR